MRLGFEAAGGHCVFTSEWDRFAQETYRANFDCSHHAVAGDITKVPADAIPPHDVLLAGFPCQPFSLAGLAFKNKRGIKHGFEDKTQGTLFFDVARIISYHRPKAFLLENVMNLVSHDQGRTFKTILEVLQDELRYDTQWRILDARQLVPQNRKRSFIIGFREDTGFDFDGFQIRGRKPPPRLGDILHPQDGSEQPEPPYTETVRGLVSPKYTISKQHWEWSHCHAEKTGGAFTHTVCKPDDIARTLTASYGKDARTCLVSQGRGRRPRKLTPRECARLMDFPRDWIIPVRQSQAYKQFGNTVVPSLIAQLAAYMSPYIHKTG